MSRALKFMKKVPRSDLRAELVRGIIIMTVRLEGNLASDGYQSWSISMLRKHHDLLNRQCRWWDKREGSNA